MRGSGYSGKDSTRPTQPQEGDLANTGGTRAGGLVAFIVPAASQWGVSDQDAAATLSQGHPKSRKVPLGHGFQAHDDANVTGSFGSAKDA